jgi:deoxycytidylate deaminase
VPIALKKVEYTLDSGIGAVQACLRKKIEITRREQFKGVGPASCCSFISYMDQDGSIKNSMGNSRSRIPYINPKGQQRAACAHGEMTAIWDAINTCDDVPQTIFEIYIELSPCPNCLDALNNLLPDGTVVYYSFDYPSQKNEWESQARQLCDR